MTMREERQQSDAMTATKPLPHLPARAADHAADVVAQLAIELRSVLLHRCSTYYPGSDDGIPRLTLTPRHCGFSLIYRADLDLPNNGGRRRFIVKLRREHKHGSFLVRDLTEQTLALSRGEYDEHQLAYRFFVSRTDGLSVVRPLDFIESCNAIVVEYADGEDLSLLVKARSALTTESIRKCGRWWRLFHHELHQSREREWDPAVIDSMVEVRLARLRRIGAPLESLDTVRSEIAAVARRVTPARVPVGRMHGDCKLRHVWATSDGIQVFDFGNTKVGDAWLDPAALVVELCTNSLWSQRLDSSPWVDDIRTLLRAYFDGPPPAAFALYVVDILLKKWHRRLRNWGSGAGLTMLRRSLQTAHLDKSVDRLYIDRWFTTQLRAWLALADGSPPAWLAPVVD